MIRILVGLFHTAFAVTLATDGVLLLLQAQLNTRWDLGFYGQMAGGTIVMLVAGVISTLIATLQGGAGIGFAAGQRWGAQGVLAISVILTILLPRPLNFVMGLSAALAMLDLWPVPEPEED